MERCKGWLFYANLVGNCAESSKEAPSMGHMVLLGVGGWREERYPNGVEAAALWGTDRQQMDILFLRSLFLFIISM